VNPPSEPEEPLPIDPPLITLFTADASNIQAGNSTTLNWEVTSATDVQLNGVTVLAAASQNISPTTTTEYTLHAVGPGGTTDATLTITVTEEPPPPPPPAPSGVTFTATPSTIEAGQSSSLGFAGSNVTSFVINGGTPASAPGTKSVSPTSTITYTLVASGAGGTVSKTAKVTVHQLPVISAFTASPTSITTGQSTTLAWTTTNASSLTLDGSTITGTSTTVSPTTTKTYTLVATGPGGSTSSRTATVTVHPLPVISTFTATPSAITSGQSTTLAWTTTNASSLTLDGSPITGTSTSVSPTSTKTYTLVATGPGGGTTNRTVQVTVSAAPPTNPTQPSVPAGATSIYFNGLQNSWDNWSYGLQTNAASTSPAMGTHALQVAFSGASGAFKLANNGTSGTAAPVGQTYSHASFYIRPTGGSAVNTLSLRGDDGSTPVSLPSAPANTWTQVRVALPAATFTTFSYLQIISSAATSFYIDAIWLEPGTPTEPPPSAVGTIAVANKSVTYGGSAKTCTNYTWTDADGSLRSIAFPQGNSGGEAKQFTYFHPDGSQRVLQGASWAFEGFGWVMTHRGTPSQGSNNRNAASTQVFPTTGSAHHVFREFNTTLTLGCTNGDPCTAVKVQWFMATGKSHPIYAITFTGGPPGTPLDSRSPYGYLLYDQKSGVNDRPLGGVVWGDKYRFATTNSPVTSTTGWTYDQANQIPFSYTYVTTTDSELGLVDTLHYTRTPSGYGVGSGNLQLCQNRTSGTAPSCPRLSGWQLPTDYIWPYQMNAYELPYTSGVGKTSWGTAQAIGSTTTTNWDGGTVATAPLSYSTVIVLGAHSTGSTDDEVANQEANHAATLSVTPACSTNCGSVITQGPLGVGRADQTYQKAGYDPVYSTWRVQTTSGKADVTIASPGKTLDHPIFRFNGASATAAIRLDGTLMTADSNYFASLINGELWVTINADLTGSHRITVQ
jgi:hypothetical protein